MANRYQQLVDSARRLRAQLRKSVRECQRLLDAHERYSDDLPEVITEIERLGTVAQITSLQNTLKAAEAKASAALDEWDDEGTSVAI